MRPDSQNYSDISKQRLQTVEGNKSNVEKKQTIKNTDGKTEEDYEGIASS